MRALKWIADRLCAAVALVLLLPVYLVISIWILIDDGRPIMFNQRRTGRNGRTFRMFKFRTMVNNAQQIGLEQGITDDPFGVLTNDPRITRSGRFLRRSSLDELPQILNVLLAHMSLVGPRPDVPEQVAHYSDGDRRRLEMLPGITGWAQVNGREEISWPERIAMDIWYIDHWSLLLDARIILKTFGHFIRSEPEIAADTHNIARAATSEAPEVPE